MASALYDVIIIGGGPAGLTASIYTSRANLKTLILTGPIVGGQIAFTFQVDNYPGFPDSVTGPELTSRMREQAEKFNAEFLEEEVTAVDFTSKPYRVFVGFREYYSRCVIIATGSLNKKLGIEAEDRLMGKGVFVCATCDALLYKGKKVVVVGGGDSAVQEALDLAKYAREVIVVHRRKKLTACRCLSQRAEKNDRIRFLWNTIVVDILGEKRVKAVILRSSDTRKEWALECDGVLLAIGWDPNTALFRGQLDMDDDGYIMSPSGVDTSVEGIFIAGDINDIEFRQLATACGSGCMAALKAELYLDKLDGR